MASRRDARTAAKGPGPAPYLTMTTVALAPWRQEKAPEIVKGQAGFHGSAMGIFRTPWSGGTSQ